MGIDAAAPVSQATFDAAARTVTLTAADAGSGVERIEFRVGDGAWTTYAAPVQVGDGATTLEHRAVDRLGRVEDPGTLAVPARGQQLAASATAAVTSDEPVGLGGTVTVDVAVTSQGATPTGTVTLSDAGGALVTGTLTDGRVAVDVAAIRLGVGSHQLTARYSGDAARAASQDTVTVVVAKASSTTRATVRHPSPSARKAVVTVRVTSAVEATGTVRITVRTGKKAKARTVTLRDGKARLVLRGLAPGRHRITSTYAGSADVARSSDSTVLRVTRSAR